MSKKHGKLITFLRTFMKSRPTKQKLKQRGILKERVFGCDLGEHLLNSGFEGKHRLSERAVVDPRSFAQVSSHQAHVVNGVCRSGLSSVRGGAEAQGVSGQRCCRLAGRAGTAVEHGRSGFPYTVPAHVLKHPFLVL